ncbi:MAG: hypothetical protein CL532_01670 [Aestuariivita sp.]|nr:hypothetical protein [Aestuariivita sp.]
MLKRIGLTREQVRAALGLSDAEQVGNRESERKYLNANDQLRMKRRLQIYEGFIMARYLEGYHPGTIGRILACSEESVRIRLRKAGFFKSKKVVQDAQDQE